MPCKVKTALDVSMPKRLYWVTDGSGLGCSQLQFWHAMPWGRPPQHGPAELASRAGWRRGASPVRERDFALSGQGCTTPTPPRATSSACSPTWESPAPLHTSQDACRALQGQCRSPPPHPEATASGDELGGIRRCLAPARKP